VLAVVKDKPSAALKEAPSLSVAVRDGDGNMRSGRKNASVEQKNDRNGVTHP
jgi:hypothetical protein